MNITTLLDFLFAWGPFHRPSYNEDLAKKIFKAVYDATWIDGGGMYANRSYLTSSQLHEFGIRLGFLVASHKWSRRSLCRRVIELTESYTWAHQTCTSKATVAIHKVLFPEESTSATVPATA